MKSTATVKYLRIAPRKVRLVADLIRGKKADEASVLLKFAQKSAAEPFRKALRAALAAAGQQLQVEESGTVNENNFTVSRVQVSEGPTLKRYRPRARGRAFPIMKRTSHITLELEEIVPTELPDKKKQKKATPAKATEKVLESAGEKKTAKQQQPTMREVQQETRSTKQNKGVEKFFRRKAV